MRLVVCGGGTGGHAFPAIRIGSAAVSQGCSVLYIGSYRGIESRLVADVPVGFERVHAEPVGRLLSPRGMRGLLKLAKAQKEAKRLLDEFRPDVVFGTGGYGAAPVLMAQRKRKGPYVLHEQNCIAGRTNKFLGKHAEVVCVVFEAVRRDFPRARVVVTGMPLRPEAIECPLEPGAARESFGLAADRWTVLVYGGSQGAQALNEAVLSAVAYMDSRRVQWLHVAGEKHVEAMTASAGALAMNGNYVARGFLNGEEVGRAFRAASLGIVRCGASTLSEALAWGLPCIMAPLPTAWANHQFINAKTVADAGAGVLCEQSALSPAGIAKWVERWRDDPGERGKVADAARGLYRPNATETILELLTEIGGKRSDVVARSGRKAS